MCQLNICGDGDQGPDEQCECLRAGLERIAEGRKVLRDDLPTLFLLANGIERYLKVGLHVLHFSRERAFANSETMRAYGHGLLRLNREILRLNNSSASTSPQEREDLGFVTTDPLLAAVLTGLDAFAAKQRYFLLDGVSGANVDPNLSPRALWDEILAKAATLEQYAQDGPIREVVARRLISCLQRYLRCVAQVIRRSVDSDVFTLSSDMGKFMLIRDEDLGTPLRE